MNIKHLLENIIPPHYYSNIQIRANPNKYTLDQIYESLHEASIDADFELKTASESTLHYQLFSTNLRVAMKRTRYMLDAIQSIKDIDPINIVLTVQRMNTTNYRTTTLTRTPSDVEEFLRMNYTTEEQLASITNPSL